MPDVSYFNLTTLRVYTEAIDTIPRVLKRFLSRVIHDKEEAMMTTEINGNGMRNKHEHLSVKEHCFVIWNQR